MPVECYMPTLSMEILFLSMNNNYHFHDHFHTYFFFIVFIKVSHHYSSLTTPSFVSDLRFQMTMTHAHH